MADSIDAPSASAAPTATSSHHDKPDLARLSSLSDSETAQASDAAESHYRHSLDGRSSSAMGSLSGHASVAISNATLWRNKAVSCESVRAFETSRKAQIDVFQEKDRAYWLAFEKEMLRGREENARVQRFFAMRIQADLAYAESLRKIRQVLERPASTGAAAGAPTSTGGASGAPPGSATSDQFSIVSSCVKALNTLGEVQQQLSEKIIQFSNVVKRDVVARPLDEMVATYEDRTTTMLAEGNRLDALLHDAQRHVLESFSKYDGIYREMEAERHSNGGDASISDTSKRDLWLAEIVYCINVQTLQRCRVEYVKGMSALFQQYKNLELLRVSVLQTAVDTYTRKQKLMYDELGGTMSEPMAAIQRIEPERDVLSSIRRIPKNFTAAALSAEGTDQKLFRSLRSPIASPLLVRCGFLKHQVTGSLFRSWKDVLCAITQDQFLHLIDLKETANRSIVQSSEAMLDAILTNDQTMDVVCTTVALANCRINMIGKSAIPTFEVTESSQSTGLFSSVFRMESSRKFTFQCSSQTDLIDWVVAAKRFIPPGASSITATAQ